MDLLIDELRNDMSQGEHDFYYYYSLNDIGALGLYLWYLC